MDHELAKKNSIKSEQVIEQVQNQGLVGETVAQPDDADNVVMDLLTRAHFATTRGFETHLRDHLFEQMEIEKRRQIMVNRLVLAAATTGIMLLAVLGLTFALVPDAAAQTNQLLVRFVETASKLIPVQTMGRTLPPDSIPLPAPDPSEFGTPPKIAFPVQEGKPVETPLPPSLAPGDKRTVTAPQLPPVPSNVPFISLSEAQSKLGFKIRVPSWLPDGYALKGAAAPPQLPGNITPPGDLSKTSPNGSKAVEPPQSVMLVFGNSTGELLFISEERIPAGKVANPIDIPAVKASVENLSIDGQPGQYIEGNGMQQLHWQSSDGMLYDLSSQSLKRNDLLKIAQSTK